MKRENVRNQVQSNPGRLLGGGVSRAGLGRRFRVRGRIFIYSLYKNSCPVLCRVVLGIERRPSEHEIKPAKGIGRDSEVCSRLERNRGGGVTGSYAKTGRR